MSKPGGQTCIRGDENLWEEVEARVIRELAGPRNWAYDHGSDPNDQLRTLMIGGTTRMRLIIGAAAAVYQTNIIVHCDEGEVVYPGNGYFDTTAVISFVGGHFGVSTRLPTQQI